MMLLFTFYIVWYPRSALLPAGHAPVFCPEVCLAIHCYGGDVWSGLVQSNQDGCLATRRVAAVFVE